MFANAEPLNINLTSGELKLTDDNPIELGETLLVGGNSTGNSGKLILENARDVFWKEQTFTVGATASSGKGFGWLVVSNSTLRSTCDSEVFLDTALDSNNKPAGVGRGNLWIGRHSRGILEVEDGAVISNKLYVGGGGPTAHTGAGVGAIYQRGGTVYPICRTTAYKSSSIGVAGTGFWQLEGGEINFSSVDATVTNCFALGSYGRAVFIQLGGNVNLMGDNYITLGQMNYGRGHYCLLKGTTESPHFDILMGGKGTAEKDMINKNANEYRISHLTVDGNESKLLLKSYVRACQHLNSVQEAYVNLNNGGELELQYFYTSYNYTGYTNSLRQDVSLPLNVNFNGGILKTLTENFDVFAYNGIQRCSRVAVYEKGMTIDCDKGNGKSRTLPIEAAGEGGIASIALTQPVEGCIAPHVIISGDGYGASAIPCFDTKTRTVTNVYLTCRGWGYTEENTTVKLYDGASAVNAAEITFTVADNETGGFTKKGPYKFTLGNTNSWRKTTSILEGEMCLLCDWAVPSNTVLILNSDATLDLNNKEATFCGLNGTGGSVLNGTLKLTGEWTIDAAKLAADGDSGEFDADIEICDLKISISDETLLGADTWKYVLFSVAEGRSISGAPQAVGMKGWRIETDDRSCELVKFRGTVFTLR